MDNFFQGITFIKRCDFLSSVATFFHFLHTILYIYVMKQFFKNAGTAGLPESYQPAKVNPFVRLPRLLVYNSVDKLKTAIFEDLCPEG